MAWKLIGIVYKFEQHGQFQSNRWTSTLRCVNGIRYSFGMHFYSRHNLKMKRRRAAEYYWQGKIYQWWAKKQKTTKISLKSSPPEKFWMKTYRFRSICRRLHVQPPSLHLACQRQFVLSEFVFAMRSGCHFAIGVA